MYLPKLSMMFSRTKSFCFENFILLAFGLGICEESVRTRDMGLGM